MEQLLELAAGAPLVAKDMAEGDKLHQLALLVDGLANVHTGQLPLEIAKQWLELELPQTIEWWLQIVHNGLHRQFVIPDKLATIDNSSAQKVSADSSGIADGESKSKSADVSLRLANVYCLSAAMNPKWLFRFSDKLITLKQQLLRGANPNKQLLLEELLLDWQVLCRS